jgi:hypothetical protein
MAARGADPIRSAPRVHYSHDKEQMMGAVLDLVQIRMDDIEALDLSMIKRKLQDPEEGMGWSPEECDDVEVEYRRYLALKRAYPEQEIVPNQPVDKFWHYHILDTQKYAEDCQRLFGYFLHHYPYFGMNGAEDEQELADAFEETSALYEAHFGTGYAAYASRCRTQCKPVKCK